MAKYDLTGSLEKDFTFKIGDAEFLFRKPTVREMRVIAKQFSAINETDDSEEQLERSDEAMKALYEYITPTNGDRHIAEVLDEQTVDVQVGFNDMIQKELGAK